MRFIIYIVFVLYTHLVYSGLTEIKGLKNNIIFKEEEQW